MDIALNFVEAGAGEPLVLLHGNGEDGAYFEHQIAQFKRVFHVIVPDTRGHGRTPRGNAPFTLDQFVADLAAFMDDLGLSRTHLLGFSDGANIAMLFALRYPQRVASLVLNGGNLFPEGLTDEVRREDAEHYREAAAAGDERELELLRLMMDEPHIDPASLAAVRVPTLVVAGTDDMIEEEHTRLIARSIPGAELRFVEGDHFVAANNHVAFNEVVSDFYRRILRG